MLSLIFTASSNNIREAGRRSTIPLWSRLDQAKGGADLTQSAIEPRSGFADGQPAERLLS